MRNKILGLFIILAIIILIPSCIFASGYSGIDTELQIGNTSAASSSVDMTNRIVGTLQVLGTIIAIASLIIIGMRYMFSSVQERAQLKGVIGYWITGAILVLCASNILAFVHDILDDVQHEYVDERVIESPTCMKTGILLRKCKDCGKEIEVDIPIDPDAHRMGDWAYTPQTCTTDGKKVRICNYGCGKQEEVVIPKLGHTFKFGVIKQPTCTQEGYQGDKCEICGFEKDISILVATGHSYVIKDTTPAYLKSPATCTTKAVYYYKCSGGCQGKGAATYTSGALLAHTYTNTTDTSISNRATQATCTQKATYYKKCACGAPGTETFESGELLAHSYTITTDTSVSNRATRATCTQKATYYKKCACGAKGTETFQSGDLAAHVYDIEDTSTTYLASNATCTAKARYYYKCSCGAKGTGTFVAGELAAHVYSVTTDTSDSNKATNATCTAPATYYKKCSCGARGTGTFAYGSTTTHIYTVEDTSSTYLASNATCTSAATYYYKCTGCTARGSSTFSSGEPLQHDWKISFSLGVVTWWKCERCGEKSTTPFIINP